VWDAIHHAAPTGGCEVAIYSAMITMFNELTDLRTSRLTSARSRIPIAMKILLYSGAVITVASMYFMTFGAVWVACTVTAALAGAIAHILFLIQDLDDAFAGDWRVAARPFERARRMFAKW
jgi:ABC-type transport system involved in multi-copper enzyme maturation permease subunit